MSIHPPRAADHGPVLLRASLGVGAFMLVAHGANALRKPALASIDAELWAGSSWAFGVRVASWLSADPFALSFAGAALTHTILPDDIYVNAALGLALRTDQPAAPIGDHDGVLGLALQCEVGQHWPLSPVLSLGFAPHFELTTPLLGALPDLTSIGAGLLLSLVYL